MSEENRNPGGMIALAIFLAIGVLFLPLAASLLEGFFFHTSHVENAFREIGLHDELQRFYSLLWPILDVLVQTR